MLAQPYNKLIQVIALAIFWSNPLEAHKQKQAPTTIHSKNEFCGGDGYLSKKKIGGKFGLKMA